MRNEEKLNSFNFLKKYGFETPKMPKLETDLKPKTLKTGTTTAGLICKDSVIFGTDKRASMGYFVASKTSEKVYNIQDHLWITTAGGVADAQYLVDV
ncbi:unnamed protein product, partial [marine sediment metagenome]